MLSEDKVSHLSHILLNKLYDLDLISMDEDEEASIRREIKRTIVGELKIGEEIDQVVRKKLLSLSKKLIEGSSEWEVLYKKYYREEEIKKGRATLPKLGISFDGWRSSWWRAADAPPLDPKGDVMTVKRMDNLGIVVEDIHAAIEFFAELGLELEGRAPIEGDWADGVTGLRSMRVEIAMMRTSDGHSRLEISRFLAPPVVADHRSAPVNALGYLRVMFTVEDIDDTLARLGKRGAKLVGEGGQYEDMYRLCYIRGPEGILIGLAQQLGQQTSRANPMRRKR